MSQDTLIRYCAGCLFVLVWGLRIATTFGQAPAGSSLGPPSPTNRQSQEPQRTEGGTRVLEGAELFLEPVRVIQTWTGEQANDEFGWVARRVGDLDGDQATDFVATAPGHGNHAGKAYVFSSRRGTLLFSRSGKPGQRYGNGAAAAGDVDADGIPDLIVGGPLGGPGIAEVLSGADGKVLHALRGTEPQGQFGYKVGSIGDLDGDRHGDFLVTSLIGDGGGACRAYSGKSGKELFVLRGEQRGDKFGSAVAGYHDASHRLLAVGAQDAGAGRRGAVYVYRFENEQPVLAFKFSSDASGAELGQMFLSFPGDLNQDGVPDVYCSDFNSSKSAPGGGRIFVLSGNDGKVLLDISGTRPGEGLGTSPSDAGDLNGDGFGDLAVGAWQNGEGAKSGGKVYLYSGMDGRLLRSWTCRQPGDTLGFDSVGLGDVDGDQQGDLLITAAWSAVHGPKTGRVFIVSGEPAQSK